MGEGTDHEHLEAFLPVGFLVTYFPNYLSATVILQHIIVGIPRSSGGYVSPYTKLVLYVSKSGCQPLRVLPQRGQSVLLKKQERAAKQQQQLPV